MFPVNELPLGQAARWCPARRRRPGARYPLAWHSAIWKERIPLDLLITNRVPLDEVNEAFDALRSAEGGRSVVVFPAPRGTSNT